MNIRLPLYTKEPLANYQTTIDKLFKHNNQYFMQHTYSDIGPKPPFPVSKTTALNFIKYTKKNKHIIISENEYKRLVSLYTIKAIQ